MPARTAQAGLAAAPAGGMDLNKTRIHDLLTGHPAAIPAPASIRDAARTMVTGGFRQLPAGDGTHRIGTVVIADVCGALLGPPAPWPARAALSTREVLMPPFASEQFHAITGADPECVWDALTATGVPLDYLHGMTAESDWQPGATVTMALTGQWRLTGQVLAGERDRSRDKSPGALRVADPRPCPADPDVGRRPCS